MMWWAMWCAAVVAGTTSAAPADSLPPLDLLQIDPPAPDDQESPSYVPSPAGGTHFSLTAPLYFYLDQLPHESQKTNGPVEEGPSKRSRLSSFASVLSIDMPAAILRESWKRKKVRMLHAKQVEDNRDFLKGLGKRSSRWESTSELGKEDDETEKTSRHRLEDITCK